jgi:hypothetical protein
MRRTRPIAERFFEKVDRNGPVPAHSPELGPCHIWTAGRSVDGYGRFVFNGKVVNAGHVALWLATGSLPIYCALHRCDNPPCVNPAHLYDGTKRDNALDRAARKPSSYPSGARWHDRLLANPELHSGESNGRAKISEVDAWSIRDLFASGTSAKTLSEGFDLTVTTIWNILHGDLWANAGGPLIQRTGYARGTQHGNAALSAEQVATVRREYTGRYGEQKLLAARYGVDVQTIRRVTKGITYANVGA